MRHIGQIPRVNGGCNAKPEIFDIACRAVRSTFVLTCFGTSYPVATFSQYANNWISSIEELKGTGTGKRDERQRRDGAQEGVFIHEQPIKQFLRPFCLRAKKRA